MPVCKPILPLFVLFRWEMLTRASDMRPSFMLFGVDFWSYCSFPFPSMVGSYLLSRLVPSAPFPLSLLLITPIQTWTYTRLQRAWLFVEGLRCLESRHINSR